MREYYQKIYKKPKNAFFEMLKRSIEEERKMCVVTANPEIFMLADRMEGLKELLLRKDTVIVADGIGILIGGKRLGYNIPERIPGVEICSELFVWADKVGKSLCLFGAQPDVAAALEGRIRERYPGIVLCGCENGYVEDKDKVLEEMADRKPDIVLVALGAPMQELLIRKHMDKFEKGMLMGVGGSFDVLSGRKKRAPKLFVKCNLEWLYRIATEPKRLRRFWEYNVKFLFAVRKERNGKSHR